jgi:hypothetical protein
MAPFGAFFHLLRGRTVLEYSSSGFETAQDIVSDLLERTIRAVVQETESIL